MPLLNHQICPKCGKFSPLGSVHPHCQTRFFKLSGLASLYSYHSPVGKLVRDYKYQPAKKLNQTLVDLTTRGLIKNKRQLRLWKKQKFTFLPVPLFPIKKLYRGFDQAAEILSQTAGKLNLAYSDKILIRQRWTKQQSKLSKKERKKNVKKAFGVRDKERVKNKNFVIFDDVWTTGSTIKAAASALSTAGANKIWGLTLCA